MLRKFELTLSYSGKIGIVLERFVKLGKFVTKSFRKNQIVLGLSTISILVFENI